MASIKNILIVRLSALGDVVMASPLPTALRRRYPDAKISWMCQPECVDLIKDHPDIDEVIPWRRKDWQNLWQQKKFGELAHTIRNFRRELKARKFDLALDLQGLLKSALLARMSGAQTCYGLGSAEGSKLLMHKVWRRDQGDTDLIGSEYRYLAEQLGLPTDNFFMRVEVNDSAQRSAADRLENMGISGSYFVFCPFTTRPQKHWFNSHWRELAEKMTAQWQLPILVLGGPGDFDASNILCAESSMISLAGQTSLQEAAQLIAGSAGLVGVDTGLTHIGHAKQVPTVALFGSTMPYRKTLSPRSKVIYLQWHCAPCRRNPTCGGSFDCLKNITADMAHYALIEIRGLIG